MFVARLSKQMVIATLSLLQHILAVQLCNTNQEHLQGGIGRYVELTSKMKVRCAFLANMEIS
jgi:hypothetical protein